MSEFLQTFSFVLLPFSAMTAFALVLPAGGAALYFRNEIMLAIALPPLSSAALAAGAAMGMCVEEPLLLILFALTSTFSVVIIIGGLKIPEIQRQILLASVFAAGNVCTHLILSTSPHAGSHLSSLLTGELLSLGTGELILSLLICICAAAVFLGFRRAVFSYCIDEELMRLRTAHFNYFIIFYRLILTLVISTGVLFIGPLLTSALLIFPALLADSGRGTMSRFFLTASFIGLTGSVLGFSAGIAADLPPAYTSAAGLLVIGGLIRTGFYAFRRN